MNHKLSIVALLVPILISGCSLVYIPNAPVVFNNDQQGDYSVSLRQGAYSTNLQGGYAATDNVNVGAAVSSLYSPTSSVGSTEYDGTRALEVNAVFGYYSKLTANHTFEMNVGGGPIFMTSPEDYTDYYKAYLQPSFTFSTGKKNRTDFTIITKVVGTNFRNQDSSIYLGYIEPVLNLEIGNRVRFNTQLGASLRTNPTYFRAYSPFIFNMGLGFTIDKRRKDAILPSTDF